MARRNYRLPKDYKETDIKYSVRDLSMPKATTLMQCLNIPIYGEELISHDKFRIKFATLLQSNALQTPLFGRYKLRVSTFNCPMTNYYGFMDNNTKLSADEWDAMPHWTVSPVIRGLAPAGTSFDSNLFDPTVQDNPSYLFADQYKRFFAAVGPLAQIASVIPYYYGRLFYDRDEYGSAYGAEHLLRPGSALCESIFVKPGSLLDYFGITPSYVYHDGTLVSPSVSLTNSGFSVDGDQKVFISSSFNRETNVGFSFNAHFLIAYLDCVRSYLVNKQLSYALYTVTVGNEALGKSNITVVIPDTGGNVVADNNGFVDPSGQILLSIPLSALDEFFIWLRSQNEPRDLFEAVHDEWLKSLADLSIEEAREHWSSHILVWLFSLRFGGLFCCTYEADMLQNLLTDVEGAEAFVDIVDGRFSINEFRLANRKQRRRERVAVSGGRYKDILRALWNAKSRSGVDIPDFINTSSYMIDPRNIVSTADTDVPDVSAGKSLGQMAGNVNQFKAGKYGHTVRTEDPSQVMMIVSLVPEVMYSDGVDKNLLSTRFSDDYSPQFDQVGFQDVPSIVYNMLSPVVDHVTDGVYFSPNNVETVKTVGKNVAWMRYLSNVGRVHGHFVRGFDYDSFVLSRDYRPRVPYPIGSAANPPLLETEPNGYAVPMDYQYPFIIQRSDFPNWFFQIDLDIRATRAIGKNYMPTLGK